MDFYINYEQKYELQLQNHLAGLTKLLFGDKIYRLLKFLGELLSEMQMVTCLIIYVDVNKEHRCKCMHN